MFILGKQLIISKEKISQKISGESHRLWGKSLSSETKRKISEKQRHKPVVAENVKNGNIIGFSSICEAGRAGFHKSHIIQCCKGKRKTHKSYKWKYAYV